MLTTSPPSAKIRGVKPFRFENHWVHFDSCRTVIEQEGNSCATLDIQGLTSKLGRCGDALTVWSQTEVGGLRNKIANLEKELAIHLDNLTSGDSRDEVTNCEQ